METNDEPYQVASVLAKSINALGGPEHAADDLAWASSMPQGKALLEWLSSQVQCENLVSTGSETITYQASLQPIALHEQEILENNANTPAQSTEGVTSHNMGLPTGYRGPGSLSADSRFAEEESELLDKETRLLKHRLNRSKVAARDLAQTIKTLRSEVEATEKEVCSENAKLSELCVDVDNAVTRSVRTAENLLQIAEREQSQNSSAQSALATLVRLHRSIASGATQQLASVDEAITSLPSPAEIHEEAERLHDSLVASGSERSHANDDAYSTQLDEISAVLETVADEKTKRCIIDKFLQEELSLGSMDQVDVDVKDEVSHAWYMDQQVILYAREKVADQTSGLLTEGLLPQLSALHTGLSARTMHAVEQEALVSALIEELEEIADDVAAVNVKHTNLAGARTGADGDAPKRPAREMLEDQLTELLKRTQELRPRDAGPFVLLGREDTVKELDAVRERVKAGDRAAEAWAANLVPTLSQLSDEHAELLSLVYENALVNTSPPFGPSSEARTLQGSLKEATQRLSTKVQGLEKETQLNERDKRKLTAFVEKWAR